MKSNKGQSLIEVIIVASVGTLVVGAMVMVSIISLRNTSFAKNQLQATKLAQDGLEKVRSIRDRNLDIKFGLEQTIISFDTLLAKDELTCDQPDISCFFTIKPDGILTSGIEITTEPTGNNMTRQILIEGDDPTQKKVTAVVKWTDISGEHESRLTTILRKI